MKTTKTPGQVTIEATLAQNDETHTLEISLYRSITAGVCGPWGTVQVPGAGVDLDLNAATEALARAGYTVTTGWMARTSYRGMILQAEVAHTD
jgi:hypothetical protein